MSSHNFTIMLSTNIKMSFYSKMMELINNYIYTSKLWHSDKNTVAEDIKV